MDFEAPYDDINPHHTEQESRFWRSFEYKAQYARVNTQEW